VARTSLACRSVAQLIHVTGSASSRSRGPDFLVSTYYVVKKREQEPSPHAARDEQLKEQIMRVWENHRKGRQLYGRGKMAAIAPGWDRGGAVHRRADDARAGHRRGAAGRKKPRTTVPDTGAGRPTALLERDFTAPAPNRRRVTEPWQDAGQVTGGTRGMGVLVQRKQAPLGLRKYLAS
jgi:hypothetical protein